MDGHVRIDNEWRRWIAENLMLDQTPDSLLVTLQQHGFSALDARSEIEQALASPYLHGARRLRNRLSKRDWLLNTLLRLNQLAPDHDRVARRHQLDADEFLSEYYSRNRPVIITGMMDDWPALTKWNYDYFRARCGDRDVEVQSGRTREQHYEIKQPLLKTTMRFGDYVDKIEHAGVTNDFYMTANNNSHNRSALRELWQDIVQIPEYLDQQSLDTGFFWFGPAGTRTPFHHDLTNNFMAQVIGRKRVRIVPAIALPQMYNQLHCYTDVDGGEIDFDRFPQLRDVPILDCILHPGELLFLPIGCWHYVHGLDVSVTLSFINFRWANDFGQHYHTYEDV